MSDAGDGNPSCRLLRSNTSQFNIRTDCFICGQGNKRNEKLTPITAGTGYSTRQRVLDAAEQRQDHEMRLRMISHPDLFAYDGKYHRSCYGHYITEGNIRAAKEKADVAKSETVHEKSPKQLCKEMETTVFSKKKSVVLLTELQSRYTEILEDLSDQDTNIKGYSASTLKSKLKQYLGSKVVFITQPGKSDLVCSSSATIGDALKKASELLVQINEQGECELRGYEDGQDDSVILHCDGGSEFIFFHGFLFFSTLPPVRPPPEKRAYNFFLFVAI